MADRHIEHEPDAGCFGCPFYGDDAAYDSPTHYRCSAAPEGRDLNDEFTTPAPAWCPLRSGTVTVTRP
jgi:hypothetical protein